MKQIYRFDAHTPPTLNETMLQRRLAEQRARQRILMLAVAAVLTQAVVLLLGVLCVRIYPLVTVGCVAYLSLSTLSAIGVVIAFIRTRRKSSCHSLSYHS